MRLLLLWFGIGFPLAVWTFLGPVRWLAAWSRGQGYAQGTEDFLVKIAVGLLLVVITVLARSVGRSLRASEGRFRRYAVYGALLVAAGASCWVWRHPEVIAIAPAAEEQVGTRFTFGPYPDRDRLVQLKRDGYSAVISLLHPAIVPLEPRLMREEAALAAEIGIDLISIPMFPWMSGNEESIARLKALIAARGGRYYIHCYLGTHRVHVVKRLVEQTGAKSVVSGIQAKQLSDSTVFERGAVLRLADDLIVTPYPTEEEFMGFVLNGTIQMVVFLTDPAQTVEQEWAEKEQRLLALYDMPLRVMPVSLKDPQPMQDAVQRIRALPRPLVVHAIRTDSPMIKAFRKEYQK